ncbi:unnamed protein product, partial [Dovyalis caffra]
MLLIEGAAKFLYSIEIGLPQHLLRHNGREERDFHSFGVFDSQMREKETMGEGERERERERER